VENRMTLTRVIRSLHRRLFPARETIEGYEQAELVDAIFQKTLAYEPQGNWPLMAGVQSVLDFGGGCGLHYKLARRQSPDIRWAVVETPAMAARASALATDRLRFFSDIDEAAAWLGAIEMMYSNGALQYTPQPIQMLQRLCNVGANTMLWERVLISVSGLERDTQSSYLSDNGPGALAVSKNKIVRYERIKIPEVEFMRAHQRYDLLERGSDWFRFLLKH
jgi:hypothetical protein